MHCFKVDSGIVVVSLIYFYRLSKLKALIISEYNAKGLLLTSLVLASKFYVDRFEKHTIFAAVGGISKKQMRKMLCSYLELINFELIITEEQFQ